MHSLDGDVYKIRRVRWVRQGRNQVYGIRDHSLGIGIMDPGSWVTSDGIRISQFFFILEGIKDRSLFRYFILYEKQEYSVLQGKRPLFRTIEEAFNLYTSILFPSRNQLFKAFLARISCCITLRFPLCRTL